LFATVKAFWSEAPVLRARLLSAAADQVRRQHDAYDRIAELAGGRVAAGNPSRVATEVPA
jgi:hypothetical protein